MISNEELVKLTEQYSDELYKYCFTISDGDRQLAEETAADVWLVVVKKHNRIKNGKYIFSYLRRTADRCMKHNKSGAEKIDRHELPLEVLDYMDGPETEVNDSYFEDAKDEESLLWSVMKKLSPGDREIFKLRYIDLKTLTDISGKIGIPYSTLRLRIKKIEEKIAELASQL